MKKSLVTLLALSLIGCSRTETTPETSSAERPGTNRYGAAPSTPARVETNQPGIETAQKNVPPSDREKLSRPIDQEQPARDKDQPEKPAQIELGRQVKQALMADEKLAAIVNDLKITTTAEGSVTLTGSVSTEQEKTDIENKVSKLPGVTKVDNQITVKAPAEQKQQNNPPEEEKKKD